MCILCKFGVELKYLFTHIFKDINVTEMLAEINERCIQKEGRA